MDRKYHLHLISDSTGDTLNAMAGAALAQFESVDVKIHAYALVRSEHQLTRALDHVATAPGLVFFTLANPALNQKLLTRCAAIGAECVDVLGAPLAVMGRFFGKSESHKVGRQHQVDQRYLERIETLNFAIAHDDGQALEGLGRAEVVLTGASRTSKTPTCVYLAIRGIRAANVPLVPGMPAPSALLATEALVVGLWVSPDRLVQVRRNRLSTMGETRDTDYVDLDQVRGEVAATRALFEAQGWPSLDVTRRSIEETSAAVLNLLAEKRGQELVTLVLASASVSRARMLGAAGVDFIQDPAALDEAALIRRLFLASEASLENPSATEGRDSGPSGQPGDPADSLARVLAEEKALAVSRRHPGALVLGGDSVLDFEGELVGKSPDRAAARALLLRLSGRTHRIVSAAALARDGEILWRQAGEGRLTMRPLGTDFLDAYLDAESPAILAAVGCYHLEGRGAQLFDRIEGDYFSILGLPLLAVLAALREQGILAS